MKTVNDMYMYTKGNNIPLLSDVAFNFWSYYLENYQKFDRAFRRNYLSFKYFLQEEDDISNITNDFIENVSDILTINEKKYEELYRIYTVNDDDYNFLHNYDMKEEMNKNSSSTYGSRNDVTNTTIGSITSTRTDSTSAYDVTSFSDKDKSINNVGEQSNQVSDTKGEQNDSMTEHYDSRKYGNIGVQTSTDMMMKFQTFWKAYEFYSLIFRDIAKELLIV